MEYGEKVGDNGGVERGLVTPRANEARQFNGCGPVGRFSHPPAPDCSRVGAIGAKGDGGGAGLWRLLLKRKQQPPQTAITRHSMPFTS